jgi:Bacteriophage lambda head decoration protein D
MTDITVSTTSTQTGSRSWLLYEGDGVFGPVSRGEGVINFALFTSGTHYPNGYIPSGTVLGKVTTGGKLGPYSDAAGDGRQTAVGFLFNDTPVPTDTSKPVVVAVVDGFAAISESRLPTNHGLDANGKADLPLIKFRG